MLRPDWQLKVGLRFWTEQCSDQRGIPVYTGRTNFAAEEVEMNRPDDLQQRILSRIGRRSFLSQSGLGLGAAALASYLQPGVALADKLPGSRGIVTPLHHPLRVKRVIFLYMSGGPSHLETFDPKPELRRRTGEAMPEPITKGQPIAQLQGKSSLKVLGPLFDFQKCGASGQQISSVLPHTQKIADDICIVR